MWYEMIKKTKKLFTKCSSYQVLPHSSDWTRLSSSLLYSRPLQAAGTSPVTPMVELFFDENKEPPKKGGDWTPFCLSQSQQAWTWTFTKLERPALLLFWWVNVPVWKNLSPLRPPHCGSSGEKVLQRLRAFLSQQNQRGNTSLPGRALIGCVTLQRAERNSDQGFLGRTVQAAFRSSHSVWLQVDSEPKGWAQSINRLFALLLSIASTGMLAC